MTDLPTSSPKHDELLDLPAPSRHTERWTLLLISQSGRVLRLQRVRGWITLMAALPVIALAVLAGGYLRSQMHPARDQAALGEVSRLEAEIRSLRQENERLRALPEGDGGIEPVSGESKAVETPAETAPDDAQDSAPLLEPSTSVEPIADEIDVAAQHRSLVGEDTAAEAGVPAPVAVRDLAVDLDADRGLVEVRFRVFNQRAGGEPFSGYAFVILKAGEVESDRWIVFPETPLTPAGPVSYKGGFDFTISNYMTIDFQPRPTGTDETPTIATVLIYDTSAKLVLNSDFRLDGNR